MFLGRSSRIEFVKIGGCGFKTLYYIMYGAAPVLDEKGYTPPLEVPVHSKEDIDIFIKSLQRRVEKLPERAIFGISNLFYFSSESIEDLRHDIKLYIEDTLKNYYKNYTFIWQ